jgi:hypothetical protein
MNSPIPTEPGGLPARSSGWLRIVSLSLVLAALAAPAAFAGVEFVAPVGNCTNKVDVIGDGKDLFLTAGSVQFEVFGNSVDLSNPTSGFGNRVHTERVGVRSVSAVSTSNIVVTSSNPHRTVNLTLEVCPGIANGFTQAANCNNPLTGKSVKAGDLVQCELHLSLPPGNGQLITFQGVDRLCFAAGAPGVTYFTSTGVGTTTLTGSGLIFQVPLRVQGGSMSTGQPCASATGGVQQTVKFWVGQRDIESGADFTQDSIRIVSPQ